jgi:hypothetical protein
VLRINLERDEQTVKIEGNLQLMTLFLERSSTCPISPFISGHAAGGNLPLLDRLLRTAERWEELHISTAGNVYWAFAKVKGRLHSLRHLEAYREDTWKVPGSPYLLDAFVDAPRLRHAILPYDQHFPVLVPWSQLTKFETSYDERFPLVSTLQKLVNLETLILDRRDEDDYGPDPFEVYLPHLQTLSITAKTHSYGHPGGLLDYLCLPALASLDIECDTIAICPHITALLVGSGSVLRSLALRVRTEADASLAAVLEHTPQLTHLSIQAPQTSISDHLLTALARTDLPLVALLASLTVDSRYITQSLLLRILVARFGLPGALKEVQMHLGGEVESGFAHDLQALRERGLIAEMRS